MPRYLTIVLLTMVALLGLSSVAQAQTQACDGLDATKKAAATELLKALRSYDCCDETIAVCLVKKPGCTVAARLANEVCRRVDKGQDRAAIEGAIGLRTRSMTATTPPVPIDVSNTQVAGDPASRVTAVIYLCGRCPFCSQLTPKLFDLVTTGPLKGKVRLYVRPFPIRGHAGSTDAGLGIAAAERLGNVWGFLQHLYASFDSYDPAKMPDYAAKAGLDPGAFKTELDHPSTRSRLVAAKKEGTRNRVDATPTLFIDGHRWLGEMNADQLQDVLEEAAERAARSR